MEKYSTHNTRPRDHHQRVPGALPAHLQVLELSLNPAGTIPDTRDADQTNVPEGLVRYTVWGKPLELPECGTDHCLMMRACLVHGGDEAGCFKVPPLCADCGEREPCYYAFGQCRLRRGLPSSPP